MKAIILAAGRGSRMKGLTEKHPKCMLTVAGKSLLQRQMDSLQKAGIKDISIVRGYRASDLSPFGSFHFENKRWQETNMVISLACASAWLEQDSCIVSYSDIIYHPEPIEALIASEGDIVIAYDVNWLELWNARFDDPLSDAETFITDNEGRLLEIGERTKSVEEIKGQYMGILKITPKGWRQITNYLETLPSDQQDKLDVTALLQRLLKTGIRIETVPTREPWFEIDSESDLEFCKSKL